MVIFNNNLGDIRNTLNLLNPVNRVMNNASIPFIRRDVFYFVEMHPQTKQIIPSTVFTLDVVNNISYRSPNSIITYETIGGDGGYSMSTGRLTQTVTLNLTFIANVPYGIGKWGTDLDVISSLRDSLSENFRKLSRLKNMRRPVYIHKLNRSGSTENFFGKYLIRDISGEIKSGDKSIDVTIELVEYKELKVNRAIILGAPTITDEADVVGAFLKSRNLLGRN